MNKKVCVYIPKKEVVVLIKADEDKAAYACYDVNRLNKSENDAIKSSVIRTSDDQNRLAKAAVDDLYKRSNAIPKYMIIPEDDNFDYFGQTAGSTLGVEHEMLKHFKINMVHFENDEDQVFLDLSGWADRKYTHKIIESLSSEEDDFNPDDYVQMAETDFVMNISRDYEITDCKLEINFGSEEKSRRWACPCCPEELEAGFYYTVAKDRISNDDFTAIVNLGRACLIGATL